MTPKENYLRMLRGEIPEYMPSNFEPYMMPGGDELLTPQAAPEGTFLTSLGVTYVGSPENNYGAMPKPGEILIDDITKWREKLKIRDVTGRDWEGYYNKKLESYDRKNMCVAVDGGDYFLTLVSLMGFEGALLAMYENPDEVKELLTHISKFYTMVLKKQMQYLKPDVYILMDDDAAYRAPFFSVDMYRDLFKPFHKLHCDIVLEAGCLIDRHDCGKSEQFVEDWLELGIHGWNPVQITNDCVAIKKKYGDRLALNGCWDPQGYASSPAASVQELKDALAEYVDTFAPGGHFTFSAMVGGAFDDPVANERREVVKDFFFDYARDWYKTH